MGNCVSVKRFSRSSCCYSYSPLVYVRVLHNIVSRSPCLHMDVQSSQCNLSYPYFKEPVIADQGMFFFNARLEHDNQICATECRESVRLVRIAHYCPGE